MNDDSVDVAAGVGARVLRELIATPTFQEMMKANVGALDPARARGLVKAFLWEDPGFSLGLLGAAPTFVNYLAEAVAELGRQLGSFPPDLLNVFVSGLMTDIDTGGLREIPAVYGPLLERMLLENEELRARLVASLYSGVNGALRTAAAVLARLEREESLVGDAAHEELDTEALGEAVNLAVRVVGRSVRKNPYFLRDMLEFLDWRGVLSLVLSMGKSVLLSAAAGFRRLLGGMSAK